jgi:predicted  nucleic acid-binding Zn-ribbon protein
MDSSNLVTALADVERLRGSLGDALAGIRGEISGLREESDRLSTEIEEIRDESSAELEGARSSLQVKLDHITSTHGKRRAEMLGQIQRIKLIFAGTISEVGSESEAQEYVQRNLAGKKK